MSEELKPCPFCASDNIVFEEFYGNSGFFICVDCGTESGVFDDKETAVKAWNRRMSGWIKTSERLPERYDLVLIYIANNGDFEDRDIQIGWMINTIWGYGFRTDRTYYKFSEVTHWRPLPEPPEVEE